YVLTVYAIHKTGIEWVNATLIPSLFSLLAIGLLLFFFAKKYLKEWMAFSVSTVIMLSPPIFQTARLATPDLFAALVLFVAFILILERKKLFAGLILMIFCIFIRIDLILLCLIMIVFFSMNKFKDV